MVGISLMAPTGSERPSSVTVQSSIYQTDTDAHTKIAGGIEQRRQKPPRIEMHGTSICEKYRGIAINGKEPGAVDMRHNGSVVICRQASPD